MHCMFEKQMKWVLFLKMHALGQTKTAWTFEITFGYLRIKYKDYWARKITWVTHIQCDQMEGQPLHTRCILQTCWLIWFWVNSHSQKQMLWFLPLLPPSIRPQLDSALCSAHVFSVMQRTPFCCSFLLSCGEFLQQHLCYRILHSKPSECNFQPACFLLFIKAW